ncbi:MAG: hypothetical protein GXY74_00705 [Phycisphaerae bacterium]|nr:hypothetical protein [Phycisphaerae bacterium]
MPDDTFDQLSRLASGELSAEAARTLAERMARDEALRRDHADLLAVDQLLRDACLRDEATDQSGLPTSEQRQERIQQILDRTGSRPARTSRRSDRPALGWKRVGRVAPWVLAASLAVVCGMLVQWRLDQPSSRPDAVPAGGLDSRLITQYVAVRDRLGDASMAVIWSNNEVREEGVLGTARDAGDLADVIVRVTVTRSDGNRTEQWSADALMRRGHEVELVTEAERSWPASVRICARSGGNGQVPLAAEIRMGDDPPAEINNRRILIEPSVPVSVGSVLAGPWRYEVYIEAAVVTDAQRAF